jgi:hypothetical protein
VLCEIDDFFVCKRRFSKGYSIALFSWPVLYLCGVVPSVTRIEGLLFVFFLAMLIQALVEREVRMGMKKNGLESISIYPEDRDCESPTTSRLLSLFDNIEFHRLWSQSILVQTFQTELLAKQVEILELAGVPLEEYTQNE